MLNVQKVLLTLIVIIIILVVGNIYFAVNYYNIQNELEETKGLVKAQQLNEKTLNFTNLFIEKVLKAEGEVSFEDRLKLENGVRDLEDEEIFIQWQKFVESQTEEEAQNEVKNLLEMLVEKISI